MLEKEEELRVSQSRATEMEQELLTALQEKQVSVCETFSGYFHFGSFSPKFPRMHVGLHGNTNVEARKGVLSEYLQLLAQISRLDSNNAKIFEWLCRDLRKYL